MVRVMLKTAQAKAEEMHASGVVSPGKLLTVIVDVDFGIGEEDAAELRKELLS